jgi:hypothetical protein
MILNTTIFQRGTGFSLLLPMPRRKSAARGRLDLLAVSPFSHQQ